MPEIKFDTGLITYSLNGSCEVTFNPTDIAFVQKLFDTFDSLDKKQELYRAEIEKIGDKKEIFAFARARDVEMRGMIDGIFDCPVCDSVFGKTNVYAMADGLPIWANLILSVMDQVDTSFAREQKATNPRISKYTKKYHR